MENTIKMNRFEVCLLNNFRVDHENNRIILNHTQSLFRGELHPLKDNSQFIYNSNDRRDGIMFGGMDETSLFLTELHREPLEIFGKKGEDAFYESLVPKVIKIWSEKTGVAYGRQGDWFFTPLKLKDKKDLLKLVLNIIMHHPWTRSRLRNSEFGIYENAKTLLDSRHKLEVISTVEKYQVIEFPWRMFVAFGVLSAPNHKPVILEEPHLLAQSNYLVDPD